MALGSPRRFLPLFPVNKGYTSVTLDMCQTMQMVYSQLGVHEAAFVSRPESVLRRSAEKASSPAHFPKNHGPVALLGGPIWGKRLRSEFVCFTVATSIQTLPGFAMPHESPLTRQWIVLRTVASRRYGATVRELAEELEVSLKTIRRDLDALQAAGLPLEETVVARGLKRWRIDPERWKPSIGFPFDEAVALYVARRLLEPLAGTPFWNAAQSALRKTRATLSDAALAYIDRFGETFHRTRFGESDYAGKAAIVEQLSQGIDDCREVFVTYRSLRSTEPTTYPIRPFGLTFHRGSLYLVGWAPDHQQIRHWKLDRMEKAAVTEVRFTRPADFDLEEHFKGSFGVYEGGGDVGVKVWFSAEVARYVTESTWHPSQQLTPRKDGSLVAEFQLDGTREIKAWILSFGRHAEVLGPEELRGEMGEEVGEMAARYGGRPEDRGQRAGVRGQESGGRSRGLEDRDAARDLEGRHDDESGRSSAPPIADEHPGRTGGSGRRGPRPS
jgi:predicted DNA-binding transcriptional regulator YafY